MRRSSRSRTYDRLMSRLAEDCRALTHELKPSVADFNEKAFADALAALLATHRNAVGILTVYLGSGSALKRLLVVRVVLFHIVLFFACLHCFMATLFVCWVAFVPGHALNGTPTGGHSTRHGCQRGGDQRGAARVVVREGAAQL